MLRGLIKRVMIYGYLLFVGYQAFLLLQSGKDKTFPETIQNFEKRNSQVFDKLYQFVPALANANLRFIKYPVAIMAFSGLSMLFGIFGLFALASHALYVYLTNEKIVKFVHSISLNMKLNEVVQSLDLEMVMLVAIYTGIVHQVVTHLFCGGRRVEKSCCSIPHVEHVPERQQQQQPSSQKKKKHI